MRKQYHFWPAERGFDAWDVDRLIALSRDLPVERVAIDSIREIDTEYWFDGSVEVPTVRKVGPRRTDATWEVAWPNRERANVAISCAEPGSTRISAGTTPLPEHKTPGHSSSR